MLELYELTNLEVLFVMGLSFSMGTLFGVVLFYLPLRAELDTIKRNEERAERNKRWTDSMERSMRAGEYKDYPVI